MSVGTIINELGGTTKVARELGVSAPVVSNWRRRKRIPAGRWEALIEAARTRGKSEITFETLAGMHAERARG